MSSRDTGFRGSVARSGSSHITRGFRGQGYSWCTTVFPHAPFMSDTRVTSPYHAVRTSSPRKPTPLRAPLNVSAPTSPLPRPPPVNTNAPTNANSGPLVSSCHGSTAHIGRRGVPSYA